MIETVLMSTVRRARLLIEGHANLAVIVVVGLAAFAARLYGLGDKPFWYDEVLTANRINQDFGSMVMDSFHQDHMPTYFALEWVLGQFNSSQFLLRLPSAIFGAAAASLTCAIGTRIAGRWAGLLGGCLMAFAPYQVEMGQEARSYAMVTSLILLAMWGLVGLLDKEADDPSARRRAWVAYVLGTIAAVYVLIIAVPWFLGANLAAVIGSGSAPEGRRAFLRRWLIAQGIVLAVTVPGLVILAHFDTNASKVVRHTSMLEHFDYVKPALASTLLMRTTDVASLEILPGGIPALGFILIPLVLFGLWQARRIPGKITAVAVPMFFLPIFLLLGSGFGKSLLLPRYFTWEAAPYFILAGVGLAIIRGRLKIVVSIVLAAVAAANLIPFYETETRPRWDLAAADVTPLLRPNDVILSEFTPIYATMFTLFANRRGAMPPVIFLDDPSKAYDLLRTGHRLWILYGWAIPGRIISTGQFAGIVARFGVPQRHFAEGRNVQVWFFDPRFLPRKH